MKGLEVIFFDLDHTLWDYDRNASETLQEIFQQFDLRPWFQEPAIFIDRFRCLNEELWMRYNHGKIGREEIRNQRFETLLANEGLANAALAKQISDYFIHKCPTKAHLIDGAMDVLSSLKEKFRLAVITNGFTDTQTIKLASSGLNDFFEITVTSETANARKPDEAIFRFALEKMRASDEVSMMVGDNLTTDILGAQNAGMRSIWLTNSKSMAPKPDFKVKSLREIPILLSGETIH